MSVTGLAIGARHTPVGTELTADVAVNAVTLPVDWSEPFGDEGGSLDLNGEVLDYTTADDDADTITLAAGLPTAASAGDRVYVVEGGQVLKDYRLVVDLGEGDPVTVPIPYGERDLWPEGEYDDPVTVVISDDYTALLDVPNRTPVRDAAYIDPATLPDTSEPTEPPASSPTLTTTGSSDAITVVAHGVVEPSTVLDYYIDGVLAESTRSTIHVFRSDATGNPLVKDTPYTFHVVARNSVDAAPASPSVVGQLNPAVNSELVQAIVRTGFVLAGVIEVGNIRIDSDEGIVIPLATGGEIRFPADGSPAVIEAILRTADLTVNGGLVINGTTNNVNGKMFLASGTPNPATPMAMSWFSHKFRQRLNGTATAAQDARGMARMPDGSRWAIINWLPTDGEKELLIFDPATWNIVARVHSDDALLNMTSVTATANGFFVLGERWNSSAGESQWRIHHYDTAGNLVKGAWIHDHNGNRMVNTSAYIDGAIAHVPSNGRLMVAKITGAGRIRFFEYDAALEPAPFSTKVEPLSTFISAVDGPVADYLHGGMYVGTADLGATRIVLSAWIGDVNGVHVYTTAGAYVPTQQWATRRPMGLVWDGTRFIGLDHDAEGAYLTDYNTHTADVTCYAQYTWYDTNATNGNKESAPSPVNSRVIPKRCWPVLQVPAPPNSGTGDDTPNAVRVYLDTDSATRLLTTITTGQATSYTAPALNGTGAAPPAASSFPASSATGEIASANGQTYIRGDASGRTGGWSWTSAGGGTMGKGSVGTDTDTDGFKRSVMDAALDLINERKRTGDTTAAISAVNTVTETQVTFSTPFPDHLPIPKVFTQMKDLGNTTMARVTVMAATVTRAGFRVQAIRSVGNAGIDFTYTAESGLGT